MILKLKPGLKAAEIKKITDRISVLLPGAALTRNRGVISVSASPALLADRLSRLESLPGIMRSELSLAEICPLALTVSPPELSILYGKRPGDKFILIAGPCAIEDEAGYLKLASGLKAAGATALRAGVFKPRTSPYAFQGLGATGFKMIRKAVRRTGLAAVTEATSEKQLNLIRRYCGVVQIGARNMRNYELLKEAARTGMPVLLKRAPGSALKDWLLSAEYLLKYGNENIILCERGDAFSNHEKRGLNLEMIRQAVRTTALPVIADPCHASADRGQVPEQAMAAIRAGADGLMLEVSLDPDSAIMDGRQTLALASFAKLAKAIKKLRNS